MYISVNFTYNKWSLSLTVYCLNVTNIMWYIDQIVGSIPATGIYFWLKIRWFIDKFNFIISAWKQVRSDQK